MMKRSIGITFGISFLVTFVVGIALFSMLGTPDLPQGMMGSMMQDYNLPDWSHLLIIFEISLLIAALFTALNYVENQRIVRHYEKDIERLQQNERPENENLAAVGKRAAELSAEIQRLSAEETSVRAEIVEEERKRISRELHDSVSQELFAATMILSAVTEAGDSVSSDQIQTQTALALKILQEAQNEMRALLLHLRPTELSGQTLVAGLRGLIEELSAKISSNINYKLSDVEASATVEDNLFRMAQEILSNTLRHSQAENIDISLREQGGLILFKIRDDGVGFNPDEIKQASYGLKNLEERALLLGGEIAVTSQPNQGTTVEIRVPKVIDEKEKEN